MHNNLAIRIAHKLDVSLAYRRRIGARRGMDLDVTFDLAPVGSGTLEGAVVLETNDIRWPRTMVPVHIQVIPNNRLRLQHVL